MNDAAYFDVYGYRFVVRGSAELVHAMTREFAHFPGRETPDAVEIIGRLEEPRYDELPPLDAAVHSARNISYSQGGSSYIDYHGRALAKYETASGRFEVSSLDADLLYEACYLYLLSHIGEALDEKGLHRIHAVAAAVDGRAMLVLLPMGGGKSTLAAELIEHPGVKLLSDDSPLIDKQGRVHSFPTHLGLLPGSEDSIPERYQRKIRRMEFGPKVLIDYEFFSDKVAGAADGAFLFLGRRNLGMECRIEPAGSLRALKGVVENCVVGLGLFQGMEFVFQRPLSEVLHKIPIAFSRLRNGYKLLRRSQVYDVSLGRSTKRNVEAMLAHVRRCSAG